ncbi:glucokinase [Roseitranquillus sediminis]|uniref:glucokinase n=1 Tax=Roseitranquillus sediminis TaxID=2809051 RepID=UPI001D0C1A58|nr:glucokinase [Roseitranquillus sediminis]MBM9594387.1 glucokinase [Roseitranquillus sediminis]
MSDGALVLVADLGGTNTRVALARGKTVLPETVERFLNAGYDGIDRILADYLRASEHAGECRGACVAVAGPVHDGRARITNLGWVIDRDTVGRATRAGTVAVLNDLQAQGHAIGHIDQSQLTSIFEGEAADRLATKLVVGIGTGFNAAPVYDTESGRFVPAAEAGHASLPVRTDAQVRLARFVESAHGFAAVEDVLSGRGLERVYAWLGEEAGDARSQTARGITASCASGDDPRAEAAVRTFSQMLGVVTGDLALNYLPFGGIFLVGGVARSFAPYLPRMGYREAFRDKGRFASFMDTFSVTVVEDDYAALTGCATHLAQLMV